MTTSAAFTERRRELRPRPYQQNAVDAVFAACENGESSALIQAATGAGKTIIFSLLIKQWLSRNPEARIAVLAHRRELVAQAREKLLKVFPDVKAGVVCASLEKKRDFEQSVTIGSIQTLARQESLEPFDLIIIDEVHRLPPKSVDSQMRRFLDDARERNPNFFLLGVTATPFRMGHGYIYGPRCQNPEANWFEKRHASISIETLQEEKFLSPYLQMVAETDMRRDLKSCAKDSFGEYEARDLENTVVKVEHLKSTVRTLEAHAQDRRAIVIFCVSIGHTVRLTEAFAEEGIVCEAIHSEMTLSERDDILNRFNRGETRILANVGVLTEGWDAPRTDCIVLCRPTLSAALYVQMVGRGLRTFSGKKDCLVLDLVGCFETHGSIRTPLVEVDSQNPIKATEFKHDRACPACEEIVPLRTSSCPHCGRELGPVVVTVDSLQALSVAEEDERRLADCDACMVSYRQEEWELELLSDDLDSNPLGIWYCPEGHPAKVMEPTCPVKKGGEYEVLALRAFSVKGEDLELEITLLDRERDPYRFRMNLGEDSLPAIRDWLNHCRLKSTGMKEVSDALDRIPNGLLTYRPKIRLKLTAEGVLVEFN
jgi:DNA repair protein RadD